MAGKPAYVSCPASEVEGILYTLDPKGLAISPGVLIPFINSKGFNKCINLSRYCIGIRKWYVIIATDIIKISSL